MKIISLKKKRNDVEIIFDDGRLILLDYRVVVDNGLRKNDELSEMEINDLINRSELNKIKDSAFRLLARRQHSSYEIKLKLLKKGYSKVLIEDAINGLKENNFINDNEFAQTYFNERAFKKKNGIIKIKSELNKKGIERKLIDQIVGSYNSEQFLENAIDLVQKKIKLLRRKETDKRKLKQKLFAYLIAKGYDTETIYSVFNKLQFNQEEV